MTAVEHTESGDGQAEIPRRSLRLEDVRVVNKTALRRAVAGTVVGNVIEWYEFGVFGYLITTMGPVFLPESDPTVQTLYLFGTFAVTFLARPLGGVFFGWLGDKIGRRRTLTITLLVMAAATFATGLLPGYETWGIWAAVCLMLLKLVQGFSASGEYTGGATFISEYAPDRRRGFYTGFMGSSYLGFAIGAGFVSILQLSLGPAAMEQYGWRIPFLVAGPLAAIGLYFRYRIEESPTFAAVLRAQATESTAVQTKGVFEVVRSHGPLILAVIGISAAGNVIAYTLTSFTPTYLTTSLGFDSAHGTLVTFPLFVVAAIGTWAFAALSDRIGRKPILYAGAATALVLPVPAFMLMRLEQPWSAVVGTALIVLPAMMFSSSFAATLPAQFPTASRASALGLSYNVGNAAFGGTAPFAIAALIGATGDPMTPAYYLMAAAVIGGISALFLKETAGRPLLGSLPNVASAEEARDLVTNQHTDSLIDVESMPLVDASASTAHRGSHL